jgi:hypothetical protein
MKKLFVTVALLFVGVSLFAQSLDLSKLPSGKWVDPNYDATWEISSSGLRILYSDGTVAFDFTGKTINDQKLGASTGIPPQPNITFSCPEAGRTYIISTSLPSTDLDLKIDRPGQPQYSVKLKKQ